MVSVEIELTKSVVWFSILCDYTCHLLCGEIKCLGSESKDLCCLFSLELGGWERHEWSSLKYITSLLLHVSGLTSVI
jgi:hypothetical protein